LKHVFSYLEDIQEQLVDDRIDTTDQSLEGAQRRLQDSYKKLVRFAEEKLGVELEYTDTEKTPVSYEVADNFSPNGAGDRATSDILTTTRMSTGESPEGSKNQGGPPTPDTGDMSRSDESVERPEALAQIEDELHELQKLHQKYRKKQAKWEKRLGRPMRQFSERLSQAEGVIGKATGALGFLEADARDIDTSELTTRLLERVTNAKAALRDLETVIANIKQKETAATEEAWYTAGGGSFDDEADLIRRAEGKRQAAAATAADSTASTGGGTVDRPLATAEVAPGTPRRTSTGRPAGSSTCSDRSRGRGGRVNPGSGGAE